MSDAADYRWESVTRPPDRLQQLGGDVVGALGISHQTP